MAIPRVFVSSTCYDLRYIRENLKYFIRTLGYEPILSEEGSIFFDPAKDVLDSCVSEVPNCQLFVLVVGGRFGAEYKGTEKSITNMEYNEAVKLRIPVFALVEQAVNAQYEVYFTNKKNKNIDENQISYPAVDSTKIFDFIETVRHNAINNALVPFNDFSDIESYLRQQWAGMMFSFLVNRNEDERVADLMSGLTSMNEKIEFLSKQILKTVGSSESTLLVELYDFMLDNPAIKALIDTGHKPDPITILQSSTLSECAKALGKEFIVTEGGGYTSTSIGEIDRRHLETMEKKYSTFKKQMLDMVKAKDLTVKQFIAAIQAK